MKRHNKTSKVLQFLFGISLSCSMLQAASYEFPINDPRLGLDPNEIQRLAPFARFSMEEFSTGNGQIRYKLPQVLTGNPVTVEMTRQEHAETDETRIYQGDNVAGTCTGPIEQPNCSVNFFNLNLNSPASHNARLAAANQIYQHPDQVASAMRVAELFEQQPIGVIDSTQPTSNIELPGTWWTFRYYVNDGPQEGRMCFYRSNYGPDYGSVVGNYRVSRDAQCFTGPCNSCNNRCGLCGTIDNVKVHGQQMTGVWNANSQSGWVIFSFQGNHPYNRSYQGTFELKNPSLKAGSWNGRQLR